MARLLKKTVPGPWKNRDLDVTALQKLLAVSDKVKVSGGIVKNIVLRLQTEKGFVKVVMTGSASDPKEWQEHIKNKSRRGQIGDNLKDPNNELKLIIVRELNYNYL